jgi:hypothetical protein
VLHVQWAALRLLFAALYNIVLLRHRPIVEWLKTRLTYPRTGYVTSPYSPQDELPQLPDLAALCLQADPVRLAKTGRDQRERRKRMILVLAMLLAAVVGTMFIDRPWVYAAAGVDLALALWVMNGKDFRLSRFAIGGIPLVGLSTAMFPPGLVTPAHRLGYFVAAGSLLIVADGSWALGHYLWRHPATRVLAE